MTETPHRESVAGSSTARIVLTTGLVLSIALGLVDATVGALLDPIPYASFLLFLLPLGVTTGVLFITYNLLWLVAVSHAARFFGLAVLPAAVSLAVFLGMSFLLTLPYGWLLVWPLSNEYVSQVPFFFLIALLASVVTLVVSKDVADGYRGRRIGLFLVLACMVLALVTLICWRFRYEIGCFVLSPSLKVSVFYAWIVIAGTAVFRVAARRAEAASLLAVSLCLMLLTPFVSIATAGLSGQPFVTSGRTSHRVKRVILISVDTLRADAVYDSDSSNPLTPNIGELAEDGFLFTHAYAPAPWTLPSLASLMTGLPVSVHLTRQKTSSLPDTLPTLAEYMRDAGYMTMGVVINKFLSPSFNLSKGFVEYHAFPKNHNSFGLSLFKRVFQDGALYPYKSAKEMTQFALRRIKSVQDIDFFLWVHLIDPHRPYTPPDEYIPGENDEPWIDKELLNQRSSAFRDGTFVPTLAQREMIRTLYDGEVRYADENLGDLFDQLKEADLYDDSLIIFTSDHGEEFWEHGGVDHGHSLYDELLRVPLILKPPGGRSREVLNSVVSLESLVPTVLEMCEIADRSDHFIHGSLCPLMGLSPFPYVEKPVISTGLLYYEDRESVVFGGRKYIRNALTTHEELYDLEGDPAEKRSVLALSPEVVLEAKDILKKHEQESARIRERFRIVEEEERELDDSILRDLKALGYI